jgi:HPt (histidine-containing phosphotransfer) domain-containing protein
MKSKKARSRRGGNSDSPLIDRVAGLTNVAHDEALYQSLLKDFRFGHSKDLEKTLAALDAGDYHTAGRLVHTLKSTSNLIGAKALGDAALTVENAIMDDNTIPARDMWEQLEKKYNAVMAELERSIPAESVSRTYGEGKLDITRALAFIQKLEPLLRTNSAGSLNLQNDIGEILGPIGEESGRLITLIENLDFPEAAELLCQIREKVLTQASNRGA